MKEVYRMNERYSERGGAGVKLLLVLLGIILLMNAGYQFIPTAYQGESFKQDMQTAVIQGSVLPTTQGRPTDLVKGKLMNAIRNNNLPYDTYINVREVNNIVTARVFYTKTLPLMPFGIYDYIYVFDHTATPQGYLTED